MQLKFFLFITLLCTPFIASSEIIFQAGTSTITANQTDIIDAALGRSRAEDYVVHLEFTVEFGKDLFLFTSKNLGKQLTISAFGVQVGKATTLRYSYTDRIQITNLKKKEAELLVDSIKKANN